jgi:serine/threonine protein kinase/tetratricopeptide (TPR) repeat protein
MSEREDQLQAIFTEARSKASPEERARFLAAACGGDAELRRQVDSLLLADAQAGDFLRQNVLAPNGSPASEQPGDIIGRYKLLQQIGEGGFGVVFMAEQQEPVRRLVALKIIKAGMDTREVIARFEAERQALALMDHPNIAKVLDAGTTESGRPYFVMDLVKGVPITEFCERHRLPIKARLRLFMQVCAGVQHAHQKGVIHRDLKPNNVLVVHEPGQPGVPKVIDFGIAKAIGQRLTDKTLFTRFEQLLGTLAYMSPEQAEWSGVDVDTRSDLYSLGVLLYELLTGTTPLEKETLARAALDEVRRMIREVEPPKPSTRLTALMSADTGRRLPHRSSPHAPRRRRSDEADTRILDGSASLRRRLQQVRGDLDWIVMKALEKDRSRRYETVNGLARDLERHLNGEPVVARPPSKAYRAGKFIRKHRVAVTAVGGVALALVLGLALALAGFSQAQRERKRAEKRAAIATAISTFLQKDLLEQASPNQIPDREIKLRTVLDRASNRIGVRFTNQPLTEAAIRGSLGETYRALGEYKLAEAHSRRAVELCAQELPPDDSFRMAQVFGLSRVLKDQGRHREAIELLEPLAETARVKLGTNDLRWVGWLHSLAENYFHLENYAKADSLLRAVLEHRRRLQGQEHVDTLSTLNDLAGVYRASGRPSEAIGTLEEVLRLSRGSPGPQHPFTLAAEHNLAQLEFDGGNYPVAAEQLARLIETEQRVLGPRHDLVLESKALLADVEGCQEQWRRCLELSREVVGLTNAIDRATAEWWAKRARAGAVAALLSGDTNAYREFAGRLLAQTSGMTNVHLARMVAEVCLLVPEALPDLEPVCVLADQAPKSDASFNGWNRLAKGMAEYRRGHLDEALRWFESVRRSQRSSAASQAGCFCAMIHHRQGDTAAARAALDEAAQRLIAFLQTGQLGLEWHEYGRVVAIRAEAERLILGKEESTLVDTAWLEAARQRWWPIRQRLSEASYLAGRQQWPAARNAYVAALREPAFDWESAQNLEAMNAELSLGSKMGITFLLAQDPENYESVCRRLFDSVEAHPDPEVVCRTIALICARPSPLVHELAQRFGPWSQVLQAYEPDEVGLARAMAAYRLEKYDAVLNDTSAAQSSKRAAISCGAQAFRAMALARLGRDADGQRELRAAEARLKPHLATFTGDFWWDLGLCQLALDEAHRLFREAPPPK